MTKPIYMTSEDGEIQAYVPADSLDVHIIFAEHESAEALMERALRAAATEIATVKCPRFFTGDRRENWIRESAAGLLRHWVRV